MATKGNKSIFYKCGKSKQNYKNTKLFRLPKNQDQEKEWVKQSG